MFLNARTLGVFFVGSLALFGISSRSFAYEVLSNCNSGAAVVDYKFENMRGGTFHAYQLVIRDQGVVNYLISTGAINLQNVNNNTREAIFHFQRNDFETPFSAGGKLKTVSDSYGSDGRGFTTELIKEGNGILFKAFSLEGQRQANWFFEDCSATSVSEYVIQ